MTSVGEPASSTSGSTGGSTSGSTGGDVCVPDLNDSPCTACTKANCCGGFTDCLADPDCACAVECLDGGDSLQLCMASCNAMANPPLADVIDYRVDDCSDVCPGLP